MTNDKHPAPPPAHPAPPAAAAAKPGTEQEKDPKGGVGPADKAVPLGTKPETMEDLGIGPRDPYPDGKPPKPVAGQPMNTIEPLKPGAK